MLRQWFVGLGSMIAGVLVMAAATYALPLAAAEDATSLKPLPNANLVLRGDARCTRCHNQHNSAALLVIGQTKHGTRADARTPPSCTACHGDSRQHANAPDEQRDRPSADVVFAGQKASDVSLRNFPCLACHEKDARRTHWDGSAHQAADVACASCHQLHAANDRVRDKRTQPEVCFTCHKEQRNEFDKPSHHPLAEGKMSCTDCHQPHGSVGPKLLRRHGVNNTCYNCHAEKRGPFVHQHQPVAEDCSHCHNPHGTVVENLLKARPPFLCQQCHTPHTAQIAQLGGQRQGSSMQGPTTDGRSGINITQGRGCVNCHTQIHGSNNPATTSPTPKARFR